MGNGVVSNKVDKEADMDGVGVDLPMSSSRPSPDSSVGEGMEDSDRDVRKLSVDDDVATDNAEDWDLRIGIRPSSGST